MRPYILAALACLCAGAYGDRLIDIPLGRKITYGTVRLDGQFGQADLSDSNVYLDWGVDASWEASLHYVNPADNRRRLTGDLSYNLIAPLTDVSPGISFGVQDVGNVTPDGRRYYVATTYRTDGVDLHSPVELTMGASYGNEVRPFIGLSFPLSDQLRLLAEHDGFRINAGVEYKPERAVAIRWLFENGVPVLSARLMARL